MSYKLENAGETERLSRQATYANYSVREELQGLRLPPQARILDAGCGSGAVLQHLLTLETESPHLSMDACDSSPTRIMQIREQFPKVNLFMADLESVPQPDNAYDFIFCRFVFQHLARPEKVAMEFKRLLKPGGRACLIDADGTLFNLYTSDLELNRQLKVVERLWPTDLMIGRKIPPLLSLAGFQNLEWDVRLMKFKGQDLEDEIALTEERLEFILPTLTDIFSDRSKALDFRSRYLREMKKPDATLYYTKFIVFGQKSENATTENAGR